MVDSDVADSGDEVTTSPELCVVLCWVALVNFGYVVGTVVVCSAVSCH